MGNGDEGLVQQDLSSSGTQIWGYSQHRFPHCSDNNRVALPLAFPGLLWFCYLGSSLPWLPLYLPLGNSPVLESVGIPLKQLG